MKIWIRIFLSYFINSDSKSAAYFLKTEDGGVACTYCHMKNIERCGGGGWTLVMKIDGAKVSFTSLGSFNNDDSHAEKQTALK